jgi:hypothetical protein
MQFQVVPHGLIRSSRTIRHGQMGAKQSLSRINITDAGSLLCILDCSGYGNACSSGCNIFNS